jgi:hypothetical protein
MSNPLPFGIRHFEGVENKTKGRAAMKSTILLLFAVLLSGAFFLASAAEDSTQAPAPKAGCTQCDTPGAKP